MKVLIFYLISIFIISPIASAYSEPITAVDPVLESRTEPKGSPQVAPDGANSLETGHDDGSSSRKTDSSSSDHSSGSSDSVIFFKNDVYTNTLEYPKKSISDRDDNLRKVYIEIISNSDKKTTLNIREFIDENLSMLLPSLHGFVLSTPHDITLYKLGLLEELESNKSIKVDEQKNDIQFVSGGYSYNISKHKLYEISKLDNVLAYSRNKKAIFTWNNKLNNSNLSNYTELCRFLESDLMISDIRNHVGSISSSNESIEIKLNDQLIRLFKIKNNLINNNSVILEYNNITTHLMSKNSSNDTSYITHVYNINDIIAFDNVEIPPGSMFVYWYYVFPKSFGTFRTETVSFTNVNGLSGFYQKELNIENQPTFEVIPKASKSSIDISDVLGLEFSVVYLGGGPQSSSGNATVEFESDSDYSFVNERGDPVNPNCSKDFPKDVSVPIKRFIKFGHEGIISVPGIWINKRHYMFNKDITVDGWWERNKGIIGSVFIGLVALIVFALGLIIKDIYLCDEDCKRSWLIRLENSNKKKKIRIIIKNFCNKIMIYWRKIIVFFGYLKKLWSYRT
jgi:hypothetical protein